MRTARLIILVALIVILAATALFAQISARFAFTQSSTVWEPISGNYANAAMADEGLAGPFDIGFTYPYAGLTYTQVKISSNGWVGLGTNLTLPYYGNGLATLNIRPLLAPLWDDLGMQYGAVQYGTFGTAPHRIFIVQWLAAKWRYDANNEFNFMVRLHETGQAELIYGPRMGNPHLASATIGINMHPGGPGNYYSILPGAPATASTTTQYNNIQSPVANGTMYIFMPKTDYLRNPAAVNLSGPKNPVQGIVSNYTVTVGNAGTAQIASNAMTAHLMRGEEVLASAALPSLMPGAFANATLSWAPDTTGLMNLTARISFFNDADSLNNETYPYTISVQPNVSNDDAAAMPPVLRISSQPNPFTINTAITYSSEKNTKFSLKIYNLKGKLVKTLAEGLKTQGSGTIIWDGRDDADNAVPVGVYFGKLSAGGKTATAKLIKLR